jgi:hypothetical protein
MEDAVLVAVCLNILLVSLSPDEDKTGKEQLPVLPLASTPLLGAG